MNSLTPFQRALLEAALEDFSDIPICEDEISWAFSPEFSTQSEKLIQKADSSGWKYVNTAWKRAVLIAVIAAFLVTTALAIPAVRQAFIRFFLHNETTHYEFTFDPEQATAAPDHIQTAYLPSYIPEGYCLEFKIVSIAAVSIGWRSADQQWIYFDQTPMPDDYTHTARGGINAEGASAAAFMLDGYEVIRIEDSEVKSYVWTSREYMFTLMCEKSISEDTLQDIFRSVRADADAVIDGAQSDSN